MKLTAAVLAAGRSQRMGQPKLFLPLGGLPLVRHVVDAITGLAPHEIIVIVREDQSDALRNALAGTTARVTVNPHADRGIGSSIACATNAVAEDSDTLLLAQGDQPLVSTKGFRRIAEATVSGALWSAARYGELVTTPVAFARSLFSELLALDGDRGARRILEAHLDEGALVDLPDWMGLDVDDPDGYRRVQELWSPRKS